MAVSKRTRFEVLRRDSHTCRYCGQSAPDVKLTVDHVTPVALGGTDDPSNLVTACADCNAGKSSTAPDSNHVAQVEEDAERWAAAMRLAAEREADAREAKQETADSFLLNVWGKWNFGPEKRHVHLLPTGWESSILLQLDSGLTMDDLDHGVKIAMSKEYLEYGQEFRYFMGVCRAMLRNRAEAAARIIAEES